jgi:4-amino-4-deoxy-L-arabinose transferase-like glycosyltransferase
VAFRAPHKARLYPGPLQVLIAFQLAVVVVAGVLTAARFQVFSPIDEAAHFEYVRTIAQEHRLPVLGKDKMSFAVLAVAESRDPNTHPRIARPSGLGGQSYEAFEPPLYYLLATPAFYVSNSWRAKVTIVRLFNLVLLLAALPILYLLARRALPDAHLLGFSGALLAVMWPGVIVRAATVSSAALEVLLTSAFLFALWRADEDRDDRWVLGAAALLGLCLLTKLTLVALVPLLLGVITRYALRLRNRRSVTVAALAVALPLLLLAPWFASNLHHYHALTADMLAREMQQGTVNPHGINYTVGRFFDLLPGVFGDFLPQEWAFSESLRAPLVGFAFDFQKAVVFGLPLLLLAAEPRWLWSRQAIFLVAPFVLGLAAIGYVTVFENWPIMEGRRLYPELPALAIFAALSWRRLLRPAYAPFALAAAFSVVLTAAWIDLAVRHLV